MKPVTLEFVWHFRHEPRYVTVDGLKERFAQMCRREEELAKALYKSWEHVDYKKPNKMAREARNEKPMFEPKERRAS